MSLKGGTAVLIFFKKYIVLQRKQIPNNFSIFNHLKNHMHVMRLLTL